MRILAVGLVFLATTAGAQTRGQVVCSYAPSQSDAVATISAAAGGAGATIPALAAATGLTAVAHSSGALILTGSSGYVAGTIGGAAAAPAIVVVGLVVGGSAVALELVCANRNHPDQVAKVQEAAKEFSRRMSEAMLRTKIAVGAMKKSISPAVGHGAVEVKRVAIDVWQYAYRISGQMLEHRP
jgi:hypothetical protein